MQARRKVELGVAFVVWCALVPSVATAKPRVFVIPQGQDPVNYPPEQTMVGSVAGGRVCVELFVQGGIDSMGVQAMIATQANANLGGWGSVEADCTSLRVNKAHPRYVGYDLSIVNTDNCGQPPYKGAYVVVNLSLATEPIPDAPSGVYFGQLCYEISPGANGVFELPFYGVPDSETMVLDDLGDPIPGTTADSLLIVVGDAPPAPQPADGYPHAGRKNRYISFQPDPGTAGSYHGYSVAFPATGEEWFLSHPLEDPPQTAGHGFTRLVSDALPPLFDFGSLPVVHVAGCLIAPGELYEIRATRDGVLYSAPLAVESTPRPAPPHWWADVCGSFASAGDNTTDPPTPPQSWRPPDGAVSGFDVLAVSRTFRQEPQMLPLTWADLGPQVADRVVNGSDVLHTVNAFSVGSSREYYPFSVPFAPGPQGQAACPPPLSSGGF